MTPYSITRGFTLIEVVVVVALIAAIGSFSAIGSLASYEQAIGGTGTEAVESVLRSVRAGAQAGVCLSEPCTENHHRVWLENGFISLHDTAGALIETYPLEGISSSPATEWLFIAGSGNTASGDEALLLSNTSTWQAQIIVSDFGMINSERLLP